MPSTCTRLASLLQLRNDVDVFIPEISLTNLSIVAAFLEGHFSELEVEIQRSGGFEVVFDQLLDLEFVLLAAVGCHALPGHVQFQHFSQFAVNQIFAGL